MGRKLRQLPDAALAVLTRTACLNRFECPLHGQRWLALQVRCYEEWLRRGKTQLYLALVRPILAARQPPEPVQPQPAIEAYWPPTDEQWRQLRRLARAGPSAN